MTLPVSVGATVCARPKPRGYALAQPPAPETLVRTGRWYGICIPLLQRAAADEPPILPRGRAMTAELDEPRVTPAPRLATQIASFRSDPPLHHSFPLRLANGARVPAVNATCGHCGRPVDPEWVHGRILDSLPAVKTLTANAYCVQCQRLIPLEGRFRESGTGFQFELADEAGAWHAVAHPGDAPGPLRSPFARLAARFISGR